MTDRYITKADRNGNTYRLEIDHNGRRVIYNYSCSLFTRSEAVTVSKRDLQEIRANYKNAGYTEI